MFTILSQAIIMLVFGITTLVISILLNAGIEINILGGLLIMVGLISLLNYFTNKRQD